MSLEPLLDLTKKAMPWIWTEAQTKAFKTLKTLMCSKPVLTQPQYNKPFIVHTGHKLLWLEKSIVIANKTRVNPQSKGVDQTYNYND